MESYHAFYMVFSRQFTLILKKESQIMIKMNKSELESHPGIAEELKKKLFEETPI